MAINNILVLHDHLAAHTRTKCEVLQNSTTLFCIQQNLVSAWDYYVLPKHFHQHEHQLQLAVGYFTTCHHKYRYHQCMAPQEHVDHRRIREPPATFVFLLLGLEQNAPFNLVRAASLSPKSCAASAFALKCHKKLSLINHKSLSTLRICCAVARITAMVSH